MFTTIGGQSVGGIVGIAAKGERDLSRVITSAPPVSKPIPSLASDLHNLAGRLGSCNERLSAVLDRLCGSNPGVASDAEKQPDPQGALMIAQFGAERIHRQIVILDNQIDRLENFV